jgi:hypothetical protein
LHLSQSSSNSSKGVIQAATAGNAGAGLLGARDAMINIKNFTACANGTSCIVCIRDRRKKRIAPTARPG